MKEVEAGIPVKELCTQQRFSDAEFYKWRGKYGGMEVSDTKRRKALEEENGKLKCIVSEQALDIAASKDVLSRKWWPYGQGVKRSE